MARISGLGVIVLAVVLSFLSAAGGALLAPRLYEPEAAQPGMVEQTVDNAAAQPAPAAADTPITPSSDDVGDLKEIYTTMSGEDEEWALGLVEEISAMVCDDGMTADQIVASGLARDINMEPTQFEGFVGEVMTRCPQ